MSTKHITGVGGSKQVIRRDGSYKDQIIRNGNIQTLVLGSKFSFEWPIDHRGRHPVLNSIKIRFKNKNPQPNDTWT